MSSSILLLINQIDRSIVELHLAIRKKRITATKTAYVKLKDLVISLKSELPKEFVEMNFADFDRHLHFVGYYLDKRDFGWIKQNFYDMQDSDFPKIKEEIFEHLIEMQLDKRLKKGEKGRIPKSKNIFIVHGKDHEPMKELKTLLLEFGLNPIVLHEQPSGSRTIVEKLEKYSDVGYAFVVLTPDDIGCKSETFTEYINEIRKEKQLGNIRISSVDVDRLKREIGFRARQNVVLEFGFFIEKLGRDRVCCLIKGDVEKPSDMHGIVYISFKDSIEEARKMIIKELQEAGYKIQTSNE